MGVLLGGLGALFYGLGDFLGGEEAKRGGCSVSRGGVEGDPIRRGPALHRCRERVLDVAGNVALLAALRAGSLVLVGVAVSFYPAVTVLLARVIKSERLRARQVVGVTLTLMALAAIAVG